ncbi:MAG: TIGR03564 family F420-dependent LLM class oxidoreductase [Acidimicrobiia bacterium]
MRIGVYEGLNGPITYERALAAAVEAEEAGFDSFWLTNIFALDALTAFAGIGLQTRRIELGTNVIPIQTRHPMVMAQQARSTTVFTGPRLTLGVGLSHKFLIEGVFGLSFEHRAKAMREYLEVLQPLLAGEAVRHRGALHKVTGQITIADGVAPPVLVAAMGPKMLAVAGALSDGTFLGWAGPTTIREHVRPVISEAAAAAGRPAPRIGTTLPVCVTDDSAGARALAGKLFKVYSDVPSYRTILDRDGKATVAEAGLIGGEDEVLEGLVALADAGATDFGAAVFAANPEDRARTMALLAAARS